MAINKKHLNDGEYVIFSTRTHAKALFLPALTLLVITGVAGYLSSLPEENLDIWFSVIWGVAGVLILWRVVWPFLVWLNATYTVTNRRLTTHNGVINRTGHDIQLTRISDVSYEKQLSDRLLGCGTLVISDASELGIRLPDVPKVEERQKVLAELLFHGDQGSTRANDGT